MTERAFSLWTRSHGRSAKGWKGKMERELPLGPRQLPCDLCSLKCVDNHSEDFKPDESGSTSGWNSGACWLVTSQGLSCQGSSGWTGFSIEIFIHFPSFGQIYPHIIITLFSFPPNVIEFDGVCVSPQQHPQVLSPERAQGLWQHLPSVHSG